VWFAQPCNAHRPTWRPPSKELLFGASRLHSLEALLAGCGWKAPKIASTQMNHGVIFVDDSTADGKNWKEYTLKVLLELHLSLAPNIRRNRIWVFDAKLLGFDALETADEEVERLALWRFD
jgi:DNA ligase-4